MELSENPTGVQPDWDRLEAGSSTVAAPWPFRRCLHEAAANGIEWEIAGELEKVALALNWFRVKPVLKEVSDAAVHGVEATSVFPEQIAHTVGEIGHGCRYQQVKVIRHQHPRMKNPSALDDDPRQSLDERQAIGIRPDNVLLFVASAGYVKQGVSLVVAERTAHIFARDTDSDDRRRSRGPRKGYLG